MKKIVMSALLALAGLVSGPMAYANPAPVAPVAATQAQYVDVLIVIIETPEDLIIIIVVP